MHVIPETLLGLAPRLNEIKYLGKPLCVNQSDNPLAGRLNETDLSVIRELTDSVLDIKSSSIIGKSSLHQQGQGLNYHIEEEFLPLIDKCYIAHGSIIVPDKLVQHLSLPRSYRRALRKALFVALMPNKEVESKLLISYIRLSFPYRD